MPTYVTECDLPGAGRLSTAELRGIAALSRRALDALGPQIQWQHAYVAGDHIFCVYFAPDEAMVRRHCELAGLAISRIDEATAVLDPGMPVAIAATG